jgi:hypothetical protein
LNSPPKRSEKEKGNATKDLQRIGTAIKKIKERWKEGIGIRIIRIKKSSARSRLPTSFVVESVWR